MKIGVGNRIISKKTGEYGIVLDIFKKNNQLYLLVFFDNEEIVECSFKEVYKIDCLKTK